MRFSTKGHLCLWALLFLALASTALANDVSVVRDPAPLVAADASAAQPVDGSRATYDGTLRVYIVEPLSPRWRDDNNRQYEQAFLDWSTVETISVPDGGTHYSVATWTAPSAYSNISSDNIAAIGVVFNAEDTVLDAYPGYGYWFTAHFADGCAYATPGLTGFNSADHGTTHTVFIEEGTASW